VVPRRYLVVVQPRNFRVVDSLGRRAEDNVGVPYKDDRHYESPGDCGGPTPASKYCVCRLGGFLLRLGVTPALLGETKVILPPDAHSLAALVRPRGRIPCVSTRPIEPYNTCARLQVSFLTVHEIYLSRERRNNFCFFVWVIYVLGLMVFLVIYFIVRDCAHCLST